MLLWPFNAAEIFLYPSPDLCLNIMLSRRSTDNSFHYMAWFVLWHALLTVGPYINRCLTFQIISNQLNLPQVDSNQVVETTGCPWAQFWILMYMWFCFRFFFYIYICKDFKQTSFTLSLWGIVCRILRKKKNLIHFWLRLKHYKMWKRWHISFPQTEVNI